MWREWILNDGLTLGGRCGYKLGQSLRLLGASQDWSATQIKEHQGRALCALMRHCYDHVPYYREAMLSRGLTPEDFHMRDDVAKLPYLTKDIVRRKATVCARTTTRTLHASFGEAAAQPANPSALP